MPFSFHLCALLMFVVCWICSCQAQSPVDCSRQVYHPKCRGISAKRSARLSFNEENEKGLASDDEAYVSRKGFDNDLAERILRDIFMTTMKYKNPSVYDEDKK